VRNGDYAKWMLDDPRINFAISERGGAAGVNHLGLQVESTAEFATMRAQFETADAATVRAERGADCCRATSDQHWATDPRGIAWEAFHALATIPSFDGENAEPAMPGARCAPAVARTGAAGVCCVPTAANADASRCAPATRKGSAACCD
jgi:hypothetical protein